MGPGTKLKEINMSGNKLYKDFKKKKPETLDKMIHKIEALFFLSIRIISEKHGNRRDCSS